MARFPEQERQGNCSKVMDLCRPKIPDALLKHKRQLERFIMSMSEEGQSRKLLLSGEAVV